MQNERLSMVNRRVYEKMSDNLKILKSRLRLHAIMNDSTNSYTTPAVYSTPSSTRRSTSNCNQCRTGKGSQAQTTETLRACGCAVEHLRPSHEWKAARRRRLRPGDAQLQHQPLNQMQSAARRKVSPVRHVDCRRQLKALSPLEAAARGPWQGRLSIPPPPPPPPPPCPRHSTRRDARPGRPPTPLCFAAAVGRRVGVRRSQSALGAARSGRSNATSAGALNIPGAGVACVGPSRQLPRRSRSLAPPAPAAHIATASGRASPRRAPATLRDRSLQQVLSHMPVSPHHPRPSLESNWSPSAQKRRRRRSASSRVHRMPPSPSLQTRPLLPPPPPPPPSLTSIPPTPPAERPPREHLQSLQVVLRRSKSPVKHLKEVTTDECLTSTLSPLRDTSKGTKMAAAASAEADSKGSQKRMDMKPDNNVSFTSGEKSKTVCCEDLFNAQGVTKMAAAASAEGDRKGGQKRMDVKPDDNVSFTSGEKSKTVCCEVFNAQGGTKTSAASAEGDNKGGQKRMDVKPDGKVSFTFGEKSKTVCFEELWNALVGTARKAAKPKASKLRGSATSLTKVKKKLQALHVVAASEEESHPKEIKDKEKDQKGTEAKDSKIKEKTVLVEKKEKQETQKTEEKEASAEVNEIFSSTKTNSVNEIFVAPELYSSDSDLDGSTASNTRAEVEVMETSTEEKDQSLEECLKEEITEQHLEQSASAPLLNTDGAANSHPDPPSSSLTYDIVSVTMYGTQKINQQLCEHTLEKSSPLHKQETLAKFVMHQEKNLHLETISMSPRKSSTYSIAQQLSSPEKCNTSFDVTSISNAETTLRNLAQDNVEMNDGASGDDGEPLSCDMLFSNQDTPARESEVLIHSASGVLSPSSYVKNLEDVSVSLRGISNDANNSRLMCASSKNTSNNAGFDWFGTGNKMAYLRVCKNQSDMKYLKEAAVCSLSVHELSSYFSAKINKRTNATFNEDNHDFIIGDCNFDVGTNKQHLIHRLIVDLLKAKQMNEHKSNVVEKFLTSENVQDDERIPFLTFDRHKYFISDSETAISSVSSDFFENTLLLIPPSSSDENTSSSSADVSFSVSESTLATPASWPISRSVQTSNCFFSSSEDTPAPSPSPSSPAPFASSPAPSPSSPAPSPSSPAPSPSSPAPSPSSPAPSPSLSPSPSPSRLDSASSSREFDSALLEVSRCYTGRPVSAERFSAMESAVSDPHENSERCRNGVAGGGDEDGCSSFHSSHLGVVSGDPASPTNRMTATSCSNSHSSAFVFVTSSSSKRSKSTSSSASALDTADEVSSSEFFSDCGAADDLDCILDQEEIEWTDACDLGNPTGADVASNRSFAEHYSPSPPDAPPSSAITTVRGRGGAASSEHVLVRTSAAAETEEDGSSDESLITAEGDSAMELECYSDPLYAGPDDPESSPPPPQSRISRAHTGKTRASTTSVAACLRRPCLAPDLVSDLPEGCSSEALPALDRREAHHQRGSNKLQAVERRPESAPPPVLGASTACKGVVGANVKDRIRMYQSVAAAAATPTATPLSRPASAPRSLQLELGSSSTRVKERIQAFNAGMLGSEDGGRSELTRCGSPHCKNRCWVEKGTSVLPPIPTALAEGKRERSLQLSPRPGTEGSAGDTVTTGDAASAFESAVESASPRPVCSACSASAAGKDHNARQRRDADPTNSLPAGPDPENKMVASGCKRVVGNCGRWRQAVKLALVIAVGICLWYLYVF